MTIRLQHRRSHVPDWTVRGVLAHVTAAASMSLAQAAHLSLAQYLDPVDDVRRVS
jgi:hypothetical protein